jgi:hypothetical protein
MKAKKIKRCLAVITVLVLTFLISGTVNTFAAMQSANRDSFHRNVRIDQNLRNWHALPTEIKHTIPWWTGLDLRDLTISNRSGQRIYTIIGDDGLPEVIGMTSGYQECDCSRWLRSLPNNGRDFLNQQPMERYYYGDFDFNNATFEQFFNHGRAQAPSWRCDLYTLRHHEWGWIDAVARGFLAHYNIQPGINR